MTTADAPFDVRTTWENHLGNQSVDPLRIYAPETIDQVAAIVGEARETGANVRAVGSGHSWSDVALTTGFLVRTDGLRRVPAPEPDFVRPEWGQRRLVRAEAGIRIKELNAHLDREGLALSNMGGYDHQTVAGVSSTSTHGSGITFGPLNDFVRSLDLVAGDGRVYRIERADGPTDPAAFAAHHGDRRTLVQSDDWFDGAVVGMGSMGVLCTAMLEVEPRYFLREVREFHTWEKVRADLADGAVLRDNRHYEVLFSPYTRKHAYPCLVTTRNYTDDPARRWWSKRTRNWLVELASAFPFTPNIINLIVGLRPSLSPFLLENAIRALIKDSYEEVSYKVLNIGAANVLPAYSAEIGVPMDGRHLEAVDRIIDVAAERRRLGDVYQSSPISFRFVRASPAHMSMMQGRDTMMIELIQLTRTEGGYELLAAYEEALYELGGRPHWGQVNTLTGSHGLVASMYPRYGDWLDVRRRLDPDGVFDSTFTKRVGISEDRFDT
ncbi:MAG TPA: D-arabinono-1,4-lactone oxidase [Solirubrobacteraceae bacterium]|nr:D-arabinono-1,4-lactone oxidase [Solirubrobacteraceae bacterium]